MPRVTTWKVPAGLYALGIVAKVLLSILVSDGVGTWVGGALGFLAMVALVLYGVYRRTASALVHPPQHEG
jgi:hypothetical protein